MACKRLHWEGPPRQQAALPFHGSPADSSFSLAVQRGLSRDEFRHTPSAVVLGTLQINSVQTQGSRSGTAKSLGYSGIGVVGEVAEVVRRYQLGQWKRHEHLTTKQSMGF